ncbi:uncharacterized protein LOC113330469 [Papaver somniferum]|uniref:uncharacterized protein LOC113330469 n=1 Tax=Papaver somniferum TaxID=3469 RepID=UPI000E6F4A1E|nr:uncharacterized protein LOC113330469 [Papaver somniferum]
MIAPLKNSNLKRVYYKGIPPFLFILVAEVFSKLMKNAVQLQIISGFSINSIQVSHLQFVDDTLVFLDAKEEEAENLVIILQIFGEITGLSVNFSKSDVISIGTEHKIDAIAEIMNCKIEILPLKYLGLPVGATARCSAIWEVVIEKLQKKLSLWKRKFFTKAGRLVLIKATLSSLPLLYVNASQSGEKAQPNYEILLVGLLSRYKENQLGSMGESLFTKE